MYDIRYLTELYDRSETTMRGYLRHIGRGVGTTGTYMFTAEEIDEVISDINTLTGRDVQRREYNSGGIVDSSIFNLGGALVPPGASAVFNVPSVSGLGDPPAVSASRTERVRNFAIDNKTSIIYLVIGLIAAIMGVDLAL